MIETKQAEEALRKSEETLRATLNSIGEAVISTDMKDQVASMNPVAESLTGWSEKEATGQPLETIFRIVDEQTRQPVESPVTSVLKSDRIVGFANHTLLITSDGREIPIAVSGAPIHNDTGEIAGVVLVFRDQTTERAAREALEESEARFRSIYDSMATGVACVSLDFHIEAANQAYCKMLGHTEKELIGKHLKEITDREVVEDNLNKQQMLAKGQIDHYRMEKTFIHKDGRKVYGLLDANLIRDASGTPAYFLGCVVDITERKRMEEALQSNYALLRIAGETAQFGGWSVDLENNICTWSDAVADIHDVPHGYAPPVQEGISFYAPEWREKITQVFTACVEKGIPYDEEMEIVTQKGRRVWVRTIGKAIEDGKGSIIKVQGSFQDITARRQDEVALIGQKDLLEAIFRNAPLVMMVVNAERRIQQVNGFATQFANRSAEEMLGLRGGEALHCLHVLDDPGGCGFGDFCQQCVIRNTVLGTLETGETHLQIEAPYYFKGPDNETRKLHFLTSTALIMVKGERMVLVTLQDITERKQAEAETEKLQSQLLQAQKMESVGRLAGGVAHDFNNMLGVILGHTEMALEHVDPGQPLFDDLQAVRKAAERSANLTRQLLTFARKQTVAPKVIDLNETVEGMLKMLRRLIGEDIELTWLPGKNVAPVKVDPSQIDQILANLCVNARDAVDLPAPSGTPSRQASNVGKITIETDVISFDEDYCNVHAGFLPGEYALLAVSDNGCGMDKATVSHLFEPFFTTKEQGKGTGLGLASVYGAVRQNDGFINVYSEPGEGTTFRIYLPRHQAGMPPQADKATAKPEAGGSGTILLVEDEPAILRMATRMLESLGYVVIAAETPGEAIRLAHEHSGPIDLLMTDVVMPEMNGRELAKNLLFIYPGIERLFMSGYTANVIVHHGVLDEGVHFIHKPFSLSDLRVKLCEVLDDKNAD